MPGVNNAQDGRSVDATRGRYLAGTVHHLHAPIEPESDVALVLNSFRRILRALRLAAGETQNRFQISPAQLFVLSELNDAGHPLSINELADRTMTDRSSVTDVIDRLVHKGYATRRWSSVDRRRAEVRITTAGKRVARAAPAAPTTQLIIGLQKLPVAQLAALKRSLGRLVEEMGLAYQRPHLLFEDDVRSRRGPRPKR